jgi:surface polysaccharide O-acyltransferase-like enzyme
MERRSDIDWLRTAAMLTIFFFHCARFFDAGDWHLKNDAQSIGFSIFTGFLSQWLMPMFFLLSGFGSWYALEVRSSSAYLLDRVKRLLVPYYFVGLFLLIPPQYYWEQISHNRFSGSLLEFIPHYFRFPGEPQFMGIHFGFSPLFLSYWSGHLWFLHYLFLISLITLPIMVYLKTHAGRRLIERVAGFCSQKGGIFLLAIPMAFVQMSLRAGFPHYLSWADFFYWMVFFLIGYIFAANDRFNQAIARNAGMSLIVGVSISVLLGFLVFGLGYFESWEKQPSYNAGYLTYQALRSLHTWCWIAFWLSQGSKYLNFSNRISGYCQEAVLPFYILHQTIILTVGFWIIRLDLNIIAKYTMICAISFLLIMAIYDWMVKRIMPLRFLFGLKLAQKSAL